jgi:hypothetical protein
MDHVIDMAHMMAGPITRVTIGKEIFIRQRPGVICQRRAWYTRIVPDH